MSALFFVAAQLVGGLVGLSLVRFFFSDAPVTAGRAVVPHPKHVPEES
jgi:Leu/Phe-tRNA-protein transferase